MELWHAEGAEGVAERAGDARVTMAMDMTTADGDDTGAATTVAAANLGDVDITAPVVDAAAVDPAVQVVSAAVPVGPVVAPILEEAAEIAAADVDEAGLAAAAAAAAAAADIIETDEPPAKRRKQKTKRSKRPKETDYQRRQRQARAQSAKVEPPRGFSNAPP